MVRGLSYLMMDHYYMRSNLYDNSEFGMVGIYMESSFVLLIELLFLFQYCSIDKVQLVHLVIGISHVNIRSFGNKRSVSGVHHIVSGIHVNIHWQVQGSVKRNSDWSSCKIFLLLWLVHWLHLMQVKCELKRDYLLSSLVNQNQLFICNTEIGNIEIWLICL